MDATRWARVQTLFHAAADMPAAEQRDYLESQCADDPSLVGETLSLLDEDARGASMLDHGVAAIAQRHVRPLSSSGAPSQSFGPYRLTRMLGEGGMGVVYLGEREDLGTVAAVKILRDAWLSPARRERFAAEQRTLAQLNHPLIARLYDAGTLSDGTPWFVMEYVEGVPLTTYCRTHTLSVVRAPAVVPLDLRGRAARASPPGRAPRPQAVEHPRHERRRGEAARLRHRQTARGRGKAGRPDTDRPSSPHTCLRGARAVIGRADRIHTDVYALGVILYELLTGALPFDRDELDASEAV